MIVLKFGGTSVATSESLKQVKDILRNKSKEDQLTVVVSALGGITNQLVECALLAEKGDESYTDIFSAIEKRHIDLCTELLPVARRNQTLTKIKIHLNDLEDIFRGVFLINELSLRSNDHILSYGEKLSSVIISDFLISEGLDATLLDSGKLIKTDSQFGNAIVDKKTTYANLVNALDTSNRIFIAPGFVASSLKTNQITTLGRGGSDYTAALIASAINASKLEIWTDVSGMMTANPKLVRLAHPITSLTYEEAMELSHFGAKVIYPPTIQPALDKEIPIYIKNTFAPEDPGTQITRTGNGNGNFVKGISSIENVVLCTLSGSGMVAVPNFSHRLFKALSYSEVNVIMITQASSEHTITVAVSEDDAEKANEAINEEFDLEIQLRKVNPLLVEKDLSIVALVGSRMKQQVGISATLFESLSHNGVNVRAIAQGSTELNISVVIDKKHLKKSLNALHEGFFLSGTTKFNLFMIGIGNVGKAFIDQIYRQQKFLNEALKVSFNVVGLANSRKMYFNEEPVSPDDWKKMVHEQSEPMDPNAFVKKMADMNLRNSIFIDCTANDKIPALYKEILSNSISVVTPNKIACSSDFDEYLSLKKTATKYRSRFLFETNVGAGLPVISTVSDLLKSGDRIHKIQAVLSGTLNFLFNTYDGSQKFSDVVRAAQEAGYTEPDPRIDLSGIDVMRKILILARESGYKMELDDVKGSTFVPDECMNADSVEAFLNKLDEFDDVFKKLVQEAKDQGKRIKYVASLNKGQAKTGLEMFGPEHPFYELHGKDNIVLYHTNRYSEQPLVVKGAGAGAEVTASGIFADIMKIASA